MRLRSFLRPVSLEVRAPIGAPGFDAGLALAHTGSAMALASLGLHVGIRLVVDMASRAMRFAGLLTCQPFTGTAALNINRFRDRFQVIWVAARRVDTEMVGFKSSGNGAYQFLVNGSVNKGQSSLDWRSAIPERGAIARPEPAGAEVWAMDRDRPVLVNLRPKKIGEHMRILTQSYEW